ncbi:single-stranded DNA-binding protein, partial [Commensalibacter papalotli (ex Botero et al. 2024)]
MNLAGYLGNDPEIKTTQSGKETASFSLATKQKWKDQERT